MAVDGRRKEAIVSDSLIVYCEIYGLVEFSLNCLLFGSMYVQEYVFKQTVEFNCHRCVAVTRFYSSDWARVENDDAIANSGLKGRR